MCVHAISSGVVAEDLLSILLKTDKICILRPVSDCPLGPELVAHTALKQLGKKYDFSFNWLTKSKLCCTELVDLALSTIQIKPKQTSILGTKRTIADSYLKTDGLIPVFRQD
jgi:hypothetical protein